MSFPAPPATPPSSPPSPVAGPEPGVLPHLRLLWPSLKGRPLAEAAGAALGVHYTTIYRWIRHGMASAEVQQAIKLQELIQQPLDLSLLCHPSIVLPVD